MNILSTREEIEKNLIFYKQRAADAQEFYKHVSADLLLVMKEQQFNLDKIEALTRRLNIYAEPIR